MVKLLDKIFGGDQTTKATKRETEKGVQERQGQTETQRASQIGQTEATSQQQQSTTTGSQTGTQTGSQTGSQSGTQTGTQTGEERTKLFRDAQFQQIADLLSSTISAAQDPTGFATPGAVSAAGDLTSIADELRTLAGNAPGEVTAAAGAASDIAELRFEEETGGQLANLARSIGSKDNTAFQKILAREGRNLQTQLAGIETEAAVRGTELGLAGLSAAGSAAGAGFEAQRRLGDSRGDAISAATEIGELLRGADATRTTTGESTDITSVISDLATSSDFSTDTLQDVAASLSGLQETSRTENTSEVVLSKIVEALARESDIFGEENTEGTSPNNSIFNQLVDFLF